MSSCNTFMQRFAKRTLACLIGISATAVSVNAMSAEVQTDRSLFVTEIDAIKQISFQDVIGKLMADAGDTRPVSEFLSGAPFFVGNSPFDTLAIMNRFDLASSTGADCGEHRIAFGSSFGVAVVPNLNSSARFIIFESRVPNPNPALGLEGCRPIAQFWAGLSAQADPVARGQALKQFYLHGINGLPPVISLNNFRGAEDASGQIRINNRSSSRGGIFWGFNEFETLPNSSGQLSIALSTVKDVPSPFLASDDSIDADGDAFKNAVLAGLAAPNKQLLSDSMSFLGYKLPLNLNQSTDSAPDNRVTRNNNFASPFNPAGNFAQAIQTRLNSAGSVLTPTQVIARVNALTCGGCHAQTESLGAPLVFDTSLQNREFLSLEKLPVTKGAAVHVEAENFTAMSGVQTQATSDVGGGLNVGWIDPTDSLTYSNLSVSSPVNGYTLSLRVANGTTASGMMNIETATGGFLGSLEVKPTGGWQNWVTLTQRISTADAAINGLKISDSFGQFNLNWLEVTPDVTQKYTVKDALKNVFLPERKANFERFLNSCTNCAPELIVNGSFDTAAAWQTYIDASANATINLGGTAKNAAVAIQNGGSQTWHVQLREAGLNIQQGKSYQLVFNAKSTTSANTNMQVTVERDGGDFAKYLAPQTVAVTPTDKQFTYNFTMNAATDSNARLTFNMGANAGQLAIDNVSLREVATTTNSNMLLNGDFAAGSTGWRTYIDNAANAAFELGSTFQDGRVSIWNGGFQTWHVQLMQGNVNLQKGGIYELSFDTTTIGKTTAGRADVIVEQDGGSYTAYSGINTFNPNPGTQHLTYTFTMNNNSDAAARVTFNWGLNTQLGNGVASIYSVDNVVLKKLN